MCSPPSEAGNPSSAQLLSCPTGGVRVQHRPLQLHVQQLLYGGHEPPAHPHHRHAGISTVSLHCWHQGGGGGARLFLFLGRKWVGRGRTLGMLLGRGLEVVCSTPILRPPPSCPPPTEASCSAAAASKSGFAPAPAGTAGRRKTTSIKKLLMVNSPKRVILGVGGCWDVGLWAPRLHGVW